MTKIIKKYIIPDSTDQDERFASYFNQLGLMGLRNIYAHVIDSAVNEHMSYADFLEAILTKQIIYKEDMRKTMRRIKARFPIERSIEDFDFSFPKVISESQVRELFTFNAIRKGANVIFAGPPGVGKTHLAIALALAGIDNGLDVRYIALDDLMKNVRDIYKDALKTLRFVRALSAPDILVFDDIDYYVADKETSIFMFELVKKRVAHKKSMIFTTNNPLSEWDKLFMTKSRTAAALDRITSNFVKVDINGDSYRPHEN